MVDRSHHRNTAAVHIDGGGSTQLQKYAMMNLPEYGCPDHCSIQDSTDKDGYDHCSLRGNQDEMTAYGGTQTDAYEAVHMSNEEAMQWVDMNAPDKPLEERRAVAALFTRAALTRRAANLVDIEPTSVTPTYGPPEVEDDGSHTYGPPDVEDDVSFAYDPPNVEDDVFDPPPRDYDIEESEGVGNASTQRDNDTLFNLGAHTSSKQAGRRRRRAAKKKRQRELENAWPPLAPFVAPHGAAPKDSFEWTEEYTDQDLNTVRLRVEASVTQGELYDGPQDIATGHSCDDEDQEECPQTQRKEQFPARYEVLDRETGTTDGRGDHSRRKRELDRARVCSSLRNFAGRMLRMQSIVNTSLQIAGELQNELGGLEMSRKEGRSQEDRRRRCTALVQVLKSLGALIPGGTMDVHPVAEVDEGHILPDDTTVAPPSVVETRESEVADAEVAEIMAQESEGSDDGSMADMVESGVEDDMPSSETFDEEENTMLVKLAELSDIEALVVKMKQKVDESDIQVVDEDAEMENEHDVRNRHEGRGDATRGWDRYVKIDDEFFFKTNGTIDDDIRRGNLPNIKVTLGEVESYQAPDGNAQASRIVRVDGAANTVAQPDTSTDGWRMVKNTPDQGRPVLGRHNVLLSSGMPTKPGLEQCTLASQRDGECAYHAETGMLARNMQNQDCDSQADTGMLAQNARSQESPTKEILNNNMQTKEFLGEECLGNLQGKQKLTGDIEHAMTGVAKQAVRLTTGHLMEHNMLSQEDQDQQSDPMTMEDVDARIRAGMFEITRYCQILESQYHGPVDDDDGPSGDAPDRVTRVTVMTKGDSTTPPHSTGGDDTITPPTTPPPTTPPPTMEEQSELPYETEAAMAAEQLWDMTTLFIKCQVLAFFVAILVFSLYILYCETIGDETGAGPTMHYGPWRRP